MDVRTLVVVVMAAGAGFWKVGEYVITLQHRLAAHDTLIGVMATRGDLEIAARKWDEGAKTLRDLIDRPAVVSCSREALLRGKAVTCPVLPSGPTR